MEEIIDMLKLRRVADSKIGDTMVRGISGGERRRVNIGVEVVTNPRILFLDEITTGLDGSNALTVIESLVEMARTRQLTIVMTIHQPRSDIFMLFDRLMLLAEGGHVAYFGPATNAIPYFEAAGFACDRFCNPSDFFCSVHLLTVCLFVRALISFCSGYPH